MVTLTFKQQPSDVKQPFDKWKRSLRERFGTDWQWAWAMEYQMRGVVHYHVFFGADFYRACVVPRSHSFEVVARRGRQTTLLRGFFDLWCRREWARSTGDYSDSFKRFQAGGIVELFRTPDAAARYVAKEAGKRHQKSLPQGIEGGHRWFWTSSKCKPISTGTARLTHWPLWSACSMVFDKRSVEQYLTHVEPSQHVVDQVNGSD